MELRGSDALMDRNTALDEHKERLRARRKRTDSNKIPSSNRLKFVDEKSPDEEQEEVSSSSISTTGIVTAQESPVQIDENED